MTLAFRRLRQGTDKYENILDKRSVIEFRIGILYTGLENFIPTMARRLRESSHLPAKDWSAWIFAMALEETERPRKNLSERGDGQVGLKNADLGDELARQNQQVNDLCGIYEWRATGRHGATPIVVYLGSTCPRCPGRWQKLQNRIVKYTTGGNHKAREINRALAKRYELWVRFKPAEDKEEAMKMENDLLDEYDYAWNIRRNGAQRQIL